MFHLFASDEMNRINKAISTGRVTEKEFILHEINKFKKSKKRKMMLEGERYYNGDHDILKRKREVIGENGALEPVENLPNNRIVDNQYAKMVIQKKNYLLSHPITFKTDNDTYADLLKNMFDERFQRVLGGVGENSFNCGIGWMYVNYNKSGSLIFKRFKPYEVIPGWADADHTVLDYLIRIYERTCFNGGSDEMKIEVVEVYTLCGVYHYTLENGELVPDSLNPFEHYFKECYGDRDVGYNWSRIPIIPFRRNEAEQPLISRVKSLQDAINLILSNFMNNMEEDPRNTIMVIVNYDGEKPGEFRRNLATVGMVKVRNTKEEPGGDVKTLQIEVNADNYKAIIEILKRAIIENAMGYDAKDDRTKGNANQLNILSMYSDIDQDANDMEVQYQAAFCDLLWFVNAHFANENLGDFENDKVSVIFKRDIMINESEIMDTLYKGGVKISNKTLLEQVPFINDVKLEEDRLAYEEQQAMDEYSKQIKNLGSLGSDDDGNKE